MASADVLVVLSDIDGLYDRDPRLGSGASLVGEVTAITPEIEAMAGKVPRGDSSGGIQTKLIAARIATQAGCHMAIANGQRDNPLRAMLEDRPCTWFLAHDNPSTARKRWIAGALEPAGAIVVDAGAQGALMRGRSLLPAGVSRIDGEFGRGDAVLVKGPDGQVIGRGLVAYSCADARSIAGHKSSEIEKLLGYRGREELIHRDDLVLS